MIRRALTVGCLLVALLASGCHSGAKATSGPPCVGASAPVSAAAGPAAGTPLPQVSLPCFDGGAPVRLAALGRPAVLNLWASWCAACRQEMPAIERFAATSGDRVAVIGVDTIDTRTGGGSVIQDLKITYPNLVDDQQALLHAVGRTTLPVTLFVDAHGTIRHVYANTDVLTETALGQLVHTYLDVTS